MSLPKRLGRLRQLERLGVGGFASVWLYRDDELQSDVAVKALADNWAQRIDVRDRFLEEARILRAADSDHVVRVYDIGEAEGVPYFVMTYADLGTVEDLLERGRVSVSKAVWLLTQAGDGLSVLHSKGVVHRDIKPANLLLHTDGLGHERVMVADLGVAKALLHASGITQVVGTPAYMAPEQANGGGVDERADVHALAAVAYQMVTGELARTGGIAELKHAELPAPPSRYIEVSPEVDRAILRGLEPDRDARWPDVHSFIAALQQAVPDYSPATPGAPAPYESRRASAPADQGSWAVLALIFFVVLATTFGAAYAAVASLR